MTAGSLIADAVVASPALSPGFEASVVPKYFTGVCLLSVNPIKPTLSARMDLSFLGIGWLAFFALPQMLLDPPI